MSWSKFVVSLAVLGTVPSSVIAFPSLERRATVAPSTLCGVSDSIILPNTPWIVFNMFYNSAMSVGTQCTSYIGQSTATDGTKEVQWSSTTNIEYVKSTDNVPKGYSFVGLTQNLETKLSGIESIPATYDWARTNTTAFKGNTCFDFMTNDVKGDSTSTTSHELMLWLEYEGGQLPIGWENGPVATIDSLFGTSWKLYSDFNTDTGILVSSLIPDVQFHNSFTGDLKEWLEAIAKLGLFTDSTYVNVGNAGTEFFYGDSVLTANLGLQINLGSSIKNNVISTSTAKLEVSSLSSTAVVKPSSVIQIATSSAAATPLKQTSSVATTSLPTTSSIKTSIATSPIAPELTSVVTSSTALAPKPTFTTELPDTTNIVQTPSTALAAASTLATTPRSTAQPQPTQVQGQRDDECEIE